MLELIFLVIGIYILITGKMPSFLFGGAKYTVEKTGARIIGLVLMLPLPISVFLLFVLVFVFGEEGVTYGTLIEISLVLLSALAAVILFRILRKPIVYEESVPQQTHEQFDVEARIAKKTNGAMLYAITGFFGVVSLIVCPLAFIYARQATTLINTYHVGEEYRNKAKIAMILSILFFIFYALITAIFLLTVLIGNTF